MAVSMPTNRQGAWGQPILLKVEVWTAQGLRGSFSMLNVWCTVLPIRNHHVSVTSLIVIQHITVEKVVWAMVKARDGTAAFFCNEI